MSLGVAARRAAAFIFVVLGVAVWAGPASAATTPFGCRASLVRVTLGTAPIEPTVANRPGTPCATASGGVNSLSIPTMANPFVIVGPAGVYTFNASSQPTTTGPVLPGAAAVTSIQAVTIPTPKGALVIVGPVEDKVGYACSAPDKLTEESSSTLDVIYLNGQAIALPSPGATLKIPLGSDAYVIVNEKTEDSTSLTERILHVHLGGLADIVLGEAKVTHAANPCANLTGGGGGSTSPTPPSLNPCPAGSSLDAQLQECVIVLPNGTVIVISKPFEGPTGGTVVALGQARKKYHSKCLFGSGPSYAIVGTNHADRITGTHLPERILGLGGNDRIAGQGGNDCIDGGNGNDNIFGGNGKERIYGGNGNDRISVQAGNSYVWGGSGNDRIFLGNGNMHVYGQAGNDRISTGRGNSVVDGGPGNDNLSIGDGDSRVFGGTGNDKIYAGNGKEQIHTGSGVDRVFSRALVTNTYCGSPSDLVYTYAIDQPFARGHGCARFVTLPIRKH